MIYTRYITWHKIKIWLDLSRNTWRVENIFTWNKKVINERSLDFSISIYASNAKGCHDGSMGLMML